MFRWLCAFLLLFFGCLESASGQKLARTPQHKIEAIQDHYRKWVNEDVAYIISDEERSVFIKLPRDEERDQFIEQFWSRRDPDPRTSDNEFKEEHYRRIQYASEHFHAGIPGWKTDRGRVYIVFGPPDRKESYPAGGSYQRKAHEGGGWTSVYPFEVWEYRHIQGVGDDIELEFVNDAGGNLYRLTMDPQDKDEFLRVPGMGLTDAEMFNPAFEGKKSFDRVNRIRHSGLAHNQGIFLERAKDQPLQKAELLMRLSKAAPVRFTELKERISAQVSYNLVPFVATFHFLRADTDTFIVPVTLSLDPERISYSRDGELRHSKLQVYGIVTTLTKRTVFEFDDEIAAEYTAAQFESARQHPQSYQRKLVLRPGKYKLDLIVKDTVSNHMGSLALGVNVPGAPEQRLATSSLILTSTIEPSGADMSAPYVVGSYRVKPQVDQSFEEADGLGFYIEAYAVSLDQSTRKPVLEIQYGIAAPGQAPAAYKPITRGVTLLEDRVSIARMIPLSGLAKGKHELVFRIADRLTGQSAMARAGFVIR